MMELISALIGVIGVVIGWILNELTTVIRERPKLCFQMVVAPDSERKRIPCQNKPFGTRNRNL